VTTGSRAKPVVAYFFVRKSEEGDQVTGGAWSTLALLEQIDRFEPLAVVSRRDVLAEELDRRGIPYVLGESDLSFVGVRASARRMLDVAIGMLRSNARLFSLCRRHHVAVVQCDEADTTFAWLGAKLAGARLVVAYRNYPGVVPRMRTLYKLPTLVADHIVATSDALRRAIIEQGWRAPARRTALIYNGIDTTNVTKARRTSGRPEARRALGIAEGAVAIGVIGSIVPIKRQAEFLETVVTPLRPELLRHDAKIYLIGGAKNDAYAQRCAEIIDRYHLEPVVARVGYCRDMTPWLLSLDIVAYPGIEGVARTLIEAQAFGLPVVALSGCHEAVRGDVSGLLCPSLTEMGAQLLRLASQPELRERMSREAERFVAQRFEIRAIASSYEEIYGRLAGQTP
jgi:glycosyltransferase involved in cell wall biosynthesis